MADVISPLQPTEGAAVIYNEEGGGSFGLSALGSMRRIDRLRVFKGKTAEADLSPAGNNQ